jgi:hypothetical protein
MKAKAHRIGTALSIGLVGAAMVAGSGQAADRPDDRAGLLGAGAVAAAQASPDAFERAVLRHAGATTAGPDAVERAVLRHAGAATARPDAFERAVVSQAPVAAPDVFERAVLRETGSTTPVRPDDRAGARGPGLVATSPTVSLSAAETGFQWDDALFGAGAAIGAVLLAAPAALTIRHRGRVIMP